MSSSEDIYPASPGWREPATSHEAAEQIAGQAVPLRKAVLDLIAKTPSGLAVHEVADLLNRPVAAVQPRFSELRRQGEIRASGRRRLNESGMSAHVWVIAPPLQSDGGDQS